MALFGMRATKPFRTRNPQRDRETDAARAARLNAFLNDLRVEIERERDGLRGRYEDVTERAAFSQQALEDDEAGPGMSSAIEDMTRTMVRYSDRLAALEEQAAFVIELLDHASLFPQQSGGAPDPASASASPPA